jgi:hypothetical protein
MKRGPIVILFYVHHFERRICLFVAGCGHEAQMLCYQNAKVQGRFAFSPL